MTPPALASRVAAVVVDYLAGEHLAAAVQSLLDDGVDEVVVVDNAGDGASARALGPLLSDVTLVEPGRNLGMGAGNNRGVAAASPAELLLIANPDVIVHHGAVAALAAALDAHPGWAIVGPTILTEHAERYPSVRRFPTVPDAVGHAVLGPIRPQNRFTRRYREAGANDDATADWVSGSCMMARRDAFEALGGFDERYFMFAEDMDLCWRAWRSGYAVGTAPEAVVTHIEGVSRRAAPRRMLVAHHVSAMRFAARTTEGPARALLPFAAILLLGRLAAALARHRGGRAASRA